MSNKIAVEYKCQHLTCRMKCHEGIVIVDKEMFQQLREHAPEINLFKSPRSACKINTIQDFLILSTKEIEEKQESKEELLEKLQTQYLELVKNHRKEERELKEKIKNLEIELGNEKEKSNEM